MGADMGIGLGYVPVPGGGPAFFHRPPYQNCHAPSTTAGKRQIEGEDHQPKGQHPEAQDRKKSEEPAGDQTSAEGDANCLRPGERNCLVAVS